jgi:hypothetical protein
MAGRMNRVLAGHHRDAHLAVVAAQIVSDGVNEEDGAPISRLSSTSARVA